MHRDRRLENLLCPHPRHAIQKRPAPDAGWHMARFFDRHLACLVPQQELVEVYEREFRQPRGRDLDGMRDRLLHGANVQPFAGAVRWNGRRHHHVHAMQRDNPEGGDNVCECRFGHRGFFFRRSHDGCFPSRVAFKVGGRRLPSATCASPSSP